MMAWLESLTGLHFERGAAFGFLLLLPILYALRRFRPQPTLLFAPAEYLPPGIKSPRERLLWLPSALSILAILCATLGLAHPVKRKEAPRRYDGIEIMLVLDRSSSMRERDLDPARTRLDVARSAAKGFVERRKQDRLGLVTFARYADLESPPTRDSGALHDRIANLQTVAPDGDEDATGIGGALARAAQALVASTAKSRLIVILTDGDENVAVLGQDDEIAPRHAAQLCEQRGIRITTIVVGSGHRGPDGSFVPLDTSLVKDASARTKGNFFAAADAATLEKAFVEIDALETVEKEEPRYESEPRSRPFLVLALLTMLASLGLRFTVLEVLP